MAGIRLTPNSNVQSTTINYPSQSTGSTPQLQVINSPGGGKGQIQFHSDNGSFAGDSNFIWNNKTRTMSVLGNIRISDNIIGKYNTNLTNLKITGGNSGQVLSTNGSGNLSWVDQISPANYGNSNVANYLPTYTGNVSANYFIGNGSRLTNINISNIAGSYSNSNVANYLPSYTGNISANYFIGNGSQLTNINISNISGSYSNSNVANYLPTYTGNLNGGNLIVTGTSYIYNISSTGLASLTTVNVSANLTTNAIYTNNYFYANGTPYSSGGSSIANASSSVSIPSANGNVIINPAPTSNIELTTSLIESVSSDCYIGLSNEFVADTEFNDDITAVQVGWTVVVNSVTYTVTYIDPAPPANQYRITVGGAAGFVSGTNYTFTNPEPIEATWALDQYGRLNAPGGALIDTSESNFEVRGANAINFEAVNVVNIYTDTSNNGFQWQFGDDGNLTLPTNSSSINYANGSPYGGGGGGGGGYIIPYEVATFEADTPPGFGEIQFCNVEGGNSAPATAQKLFINESPTNEQSMGTIFQQWTSNSYRGTLSLNNGSDSQATFNISNGRIYFNPETYRGFNAGLNQIWSDDCSINQLIITNATAPVFYNSDFLTEDDVFHATGLSTGNTHVMLNIYGSSQYNPINTNDLWNTFVAFVDNVLYDGETLRTDTSAIRTQFYNNTGSFRNNIPTQDLYQYFEFTENEGADYFGTAPTTTNGSGIDATVRIRVNPNNTYTVLGTANPGSGYIGGQTLTVLGTDLGGATPANDLTILIDSVDGDGVITQISYDSGDAVYPWPSNFIEDGDDDQYDTGNYINTNLEAEISYANGLPQTDSAAFGGGDYCVMYYQSFFCMVATGVSSSVTDLFYSGNLGFDGDGDLNWTGLRSNQNVIANNNARYAYFDCEYLDGEITPTVGTTYNMVLDSAGINLNGFYAYNDVNTNDYFFGSNTSWRVESQDELFVQSYNDMRIQTLVNQRGINESGPTITIEAGRGSPGQREINATAGNGGTLNIRGGDAGNADEIDSLGNTGGSINITAGMGTGASEAGSVNINGGQNEYSTGIAGNVNIGTYAGPNGNGRVSISTNNGTQRNWAFNADGTTTYPILATQRGDNPSGTISGYTLKIGDGQQEAIISTPDGDNDNNSSQRIVINPGMGAANTSGEGGDIYLWAGRGGNASGTGGDIKIRGGTGGANTSGGSGGDGGYIRMEAGDAATTGGSAGYVQIVGGVAGYGTSGIPGGYVNINGGYGQNGNGGVVNVTGGEGGTGYNGGHVNITGGYTNNNATYGNVTINSGGNTWTFNNAGNLTLPGNTFAVNYANGTQVSIGGGSSSLIANGTSNVTIPTANGNVVVNVGEAVYVFTDNNNLVLPNNFIIGAPGGYGNISSNNTINITSRASVNLSSGANSAIQVSGGIPNSTANINSQGGYNTGSYTNLSTTGGSGTGLTVNASTAGNGYINTVTINTPGSGYTEGDTITLVGGDGSGCTFTIGVSVNDWIFDTIGSLNLPTLSLGTSLDEQTIIQSQRKIIPPFRYSVEIDGSTPTVVYTATDNSITSMKVTMQIQHTGLGMEFFDVSATYTGPDTYYSVSNRVQPPTIANSTVVVDLNGSNTMEITVTINSGVANSWVTYDATEFGISVD